MVVNREGSRPELKGDSGADAREAAPDREAGPGLGGALRRAWVGYHKRLDEHMARAGFENRKLPDGRVLRICAASTETTASQIGRELGISRQGATKLVNGLRDRGYVEVVASSLSGREKTVSLTRRANDYLAAQRKAARAIERQLRAEVGADAFDALMQLINALGGVDQPRMSDYLRGER
jgi:DNA-binding MarR family transcriptional regulator